MSQLLDTYTWKARIQPALLTALPAGLAALAWFPGKLLDAEALWSLVVWLGVATLVEQVVRGLGRKKQDKLFLAWGGTPTTHLLRHREANNERDLNRRHRAVENVTGITLPTPNEEEADTEEADRTYEAAVAILRQRTREDKVLFAENCNYGFRRNLLALKPVGTSITIFSIISIGVLLLYSPETVTMIAFLSLLGNLAFLAIWVCLVRPQWVREAAEIYAEQLLISTEAIPESP